jgi:hypothetical protein
MAVVVMSLVAGFTVAGAQVLTGQIDGTVRDPVGAVVPGATVTITNMDVNLVQRTRKTTHRDSSPALLLSVGSYSVTISAASCYLQQTS